MKIYFEDDMLREPHQLPIQDFYKIDAAKGYNYNIRILEMIQNHNPDAIIYTNQITALSNKYCWNKELGVPELYIRAGEHMVFTRVDNLTTRQLRKGHNLMKLYMAGEFEQKGQ